MEFNLKKLLWCILIFFSIFIANLIISVLISRSVADNEIDKRTITDASLFSFLITLIIFIAIIVGIFMILYKSHISDVETKQLYKAYIGKDNMLFISFIYEFVKDKKTINPGK